MRDAHVVRGARDGADEVFAGHAIAWYGFAQQCLHGDARQGRRGLWRIENAAARAFVGRKGGDGCVVK